MADSITCGRVVGLCSRWSNRAIALDTNVIAEVFKPKPDTRVVAWLESATGDIAITAITLAELLAGVRRLPDFQRKAALTLAIDAALEPYRASGPVLAFDESAADHYADILVTHGRMGRPISMADAEIASICRFHGAVCATRNIGEFAHTGIEIIDPWRTSPGFAVSGGDARNGWSEAETTNCW